MKKSQLKLFEIQLKPKQLKNYEKCKVCSNQFEKDNLFKTYYKNDKDKFSIRIAEVEEDIKQLEKEGKIDLYCQPCYFELKCSIIEQTQKKK